MAATRGSHEHALLPGSRLGCIRISPANHSENTHASIGQPKWQLALDRLRATTAAGPNQVKIPRFRHLYRCIPTRRCQVCDGIGSRLEQDSVRNPLGQAFATAAGQVETSIRFRGTLRFIERLEEQSLWDLDFSS